ncbi:MAG: archaeosortase/exosortase family protein [Saprospiraceae bacterium]|nr:archaeosortase/exosortase family protein [Saprospiraceae bacterium]
MRSKQITFIALFIGIMLLFYGFYITPFFQNNILFPISCWDARVAAWVLQLFGQQTSAIGDVVQNTKFSISIKAGCDALQPIALFSVAMLAYPIAFRLKWKWLLLGIILLLLLNIVRIITLFLIGSYGNTTLFELFHFEIWQVTFIVFALLLFAWMMQRILSKV